MAYVYIPVQNSEEEVKVVLDQLPRDVSDILDILKAEQAPLDLWLIIAREYFKQGKIEHFRQILEEGSSPEIDEYYSDVRYDRIAILNALGPIIVTSVRRSKGTRKIILSWRHNTTTKHQELTCTNHLLGLGKSCTTYPCGSCENMNASLFETGQLLLAKGEVEQAFSAFKIVLDGDRDNVPALLGQACVQFNRGRYSDSLELYKRALQVYPECPGAVRLGIGLCRYKMGQYDKAKLAFQRVLQLDPDNVEALVALGILDLQPNEADGIMSGMEKMQKAFEIYPYCATSLNYLANHFFFTGQHFLVEQLTETSLAVTNHGPTKSQAYYNLARSYHSKGDYDKAGRYYMQSVKEISKPQDFVLPYYGLGQVQLKLGDFKSSLSNFEKVLEVHPDNCETLKALSHIHVQLGNSDKAQELLKKAIRIDPRDAQESNLDGVIKRLAFVDMGELLLSTDSGAALEAFKTANSLLKKAHEEVPMELLNNIAVLHFERGDFELAKEAFLNALDKGVWSDLIEGEVQPYHIAASESIHLYKDMQLFDRIEDVEVPWRKVTVLFNLARLFEQLHNTEMASILYRLILYKYPDYIDAYLRLAAIAKARNNVQTSTELIAEALKVDDKCPNALQMLGDVELKNDDWVKAKDTFKSAKDASEGKDSYATLCLGNWNYFAAVRSEKRAPKLEATHLEKAKELYTKVLHDHNANLYAANGAGVVFAEKGHFDVAKDLFTQVQEAASGSIFTPMPDVWINLAHVNFAQGNFPTAVKMYQNCLQKYYYGTDNQVLLYLARTYYEAEQWQDCKKTLLRAIHLAPSNYALKFDAGVAMQKFSASTLQKEKRTVDEVRATVAELKNAVRVFSQLSAASSASNLQFHGFDEKKIDTHVNYCKHLLEAAKVHCEAAEREEQQNRQKLELTRRQVLAEEARQEAEKQKKLQMERRKQEEEARKVKQQEEHLMRVKEQWKSSSHGSKRKDRNQYEDEEGGGTSEKRRRKGGKRRKRDKSSKSRYETDEADADVMDNHEEMDEEDANMNYGEHDNQTNDQEDDGEENAQGVLAATGLEDSDDDDTAAPQAPSRRRRAWSESEDDEPQQQRPESNIDAEDNSGDMQLSEGEVGGDDDVDKPNGGGAADDDEDED